MSKQTDTRGYNPVVFRGRPHRRSLRDRRLCRHLLSPLSDRAELELAIRETLRVRVIAPTDRLIAELEKGAKPATAYFALTRFVIPYVCKCGACTARRTCDLRSTTRLRGSARHSARSTWATDSVPRGPSARRSACRRSPAASAFPRVALEARLRAADQSDHRDAVVAGALHENVRAAYCRDDALDRSVEPICQGA